MIESIKTLNNFGLFENGVPSTPITLSQLTLIYGENGKGKSTLADIVRCLGSKDDARVVERKNWKTNQPPLVKFVLAGNEHIFANSKWQDPSKTPIHVFDETFVDTNVHSGHSLDPEHRQHLHQFVLGEQAVQLQQAYEDAQAAERVAIEAARNAENDVLKLFPGLSFSEAQRLSKLENAEDEITAAEKRLNESKLVEQILKKPDPKPFPWQTFKLDTFQALLGETVASVSSEAEKMVKAHLATLGVDGAEPWLATGLGFVKDDVCPFCAQSVDSVKLVEMYSSYFNEAYTALKARAEKLVDQAESVNPRVQIETVRGILLANTESQKQWKGSCDFELPLFESDKFMSEAESVHTALVNLAKRKAARPLEAINDSELNEIKARIAKLVEQGTDYKEKIEGVLVQLAAHRKAIQGADVKTLENALLGLQRRQKRFEAQTLALIQIAVAKNAAKTAATKAKTDARNQLDTQARATLTGLQTEINRYLGKFGASFKIVEVGTASQGSGAIKRVEYALEFANAKISVQGQAARGGNSFAEALSEGDRRTLALSFFLATVHNDPSLANCIIVLDDPICSLGDHRRHATLEVAKELFGKCKQLIILCHDKYFIRELKEKLHKTSQATVYEAKHVSPTGVTLVPADIDTMCESSYRRDLRFVKAFVASSGSGDAERAAKCIRIILEGYLQRKFVGDLSRENGIGSMVVTLKQKPYLSDQRIVTEYNDLNDYSLRFHHDGSSSWRSPSINVAEILAYCQRTLVLLDG